MAKILLLDIETAPIKANVWSLWQNGINPDMMISEFYLLSWAAKWLGEKQVMFDDLASHGKEGTEDDGDIILTLFTLLDEADIVVAHNGRKFDIKKINARLLVHNFPPPSPFKLVDTLLVLKKVFKFDSNSLDSIGKLLVGAGKVKSKVFPGYSLWEECLKGNKEAFKELVKYNIEDVRVLEKVYLKLLPWIDNHPNVSVIDRDNTTRCPKCGNSKLHYRGYYSTSTTNYKKFVCLNCGGWGRLQLSEKGTARNVAGF